jgi:hypothetical protein
MKKVTFACIVFNGDYVLKPLIESIYPFAHKIIFIDNVVEYWASKGFNGSTDETINIINQFPDPENKIILKRIGRVKEKTEACQAYMSLIPDDTDYLWAIDSDEIFTSEDIQKVFDILETRNPCSVSFRSTSFFGGFGYYMTGFENQVGFKRILKYSKGCKYIQHRPPQLSSENLASCVLGADEIAEKYGITMYHFSYTFPKQVHDKVEYYKAAVSKENCIDNYFNEIWLKWVLNPELRNEIENQYNGVHEFKPSYRGACRTARFNGVLPEVIQKYLPELTQKFQNQLKLYK